MSQVPPKIKSLKIKFPQKIAQVLSRPSRYKGLYGGRGSGKSFSVALALACIGATRKIRILCARELQGSIKDSVIQEITQAIDSHEFLRDAYNVGINYIRGKNGTEFLFKGLRHNYREIKSTAKIDYCWIEEAETVSEESWRVLLPTIRNENSEIWLTWNPEREESATNTRFIHNPPPGARIAKVNYNDNPWFPKVLEGERQRDFKLNPDTYSHIWEGEFLKVTDAQIFRDKFAVEDFEEHRDKQGNALFDGPYLGSDFGFSQDPTTLIRSYIFDNCLYITHEAGGKKIDLDRTKKLYSSVPDYDKLKIYADSARPESISYLKRDGLIMEGVKKWSGSIEDGIEFIRSFDKVIIHSRCKETIKEFKLYSFKVDKNSGDILRDIVDNHNHYVDALRYALSPMIQAKGSSFGMFQRFKQNEG